MRVLLFSELRSVHTYRWARGLAEAGLEIHVCSLHGDTGRAWRDVPGVTVTVLRGREMPAQAVRPGAMSKLRCLTSIFALRRVLRAWRPDLLHTHWATTNGGLAALTDFRPRLLSVWGSDIEAFPRVSTLHAQFLRAVLARQDLVLATSRCLGESTRALTRTPVEVVPWGVDTARFSPIGDRAHAPDAASGTRPIVTIGTVKRLEPIYGARDLVCAFLLARKRLQPHVDLRLLLVGGGSEEGEVRRLLAAGGESSAAHLTGDVPYEEVPGWLRALDVFCALSLRESYGVAVAEAQSCGKPLVVSDATGFRELVEEGVQGYIVPRGHPETAARKIEQLARDAELRARLGQQGRRHALERLDWSTTVQRTLECYAQLLRKGLGESTRKAPGSLRHRD